jgi:predicted nucleic acid-binding protein
MATPVFVDTGAHYALADAQDPDHAEAVRLLQQIVRLRYALVTSNFVISEVYTLLRQRLGWEVAIHYVEELRSGSTLVISVSAADEERA